MLTEFQIVVQKKKSLPLLVVADTISLYFKPITIRKYASNLRYTYLLEYQEANKKPRHEI